MKTKNSILTVGVFDGVHLGHRAVIGHAVRRARAARCKSVVVTFDPHPMKFLHSKSLVPSLISLKHRIALIKTLGIDIVAVMRFDRKLASMTPNEFVEKVLIKKFGAKEIFVGKDFRFGRGANAGVPSLKKIAAGFGIKVKIVKDIKRNAHIISSSLIRRLILNGDIKQASELLGRPFSILGTVVGGAKLARQLGYPTANINPHHEVIPPSGVYAVRVRFKDKTYKGVMNIGTRPTFYDHGQDEEPSIEVHIFNFHGRIYGKDLEITFACKFRDERKFKTVENLVEQVREDERIARRILR